MTRHVSTTRDLGDESVRTRITTDGLAETLFVEAGAGSGKTTVLVDRIVNLIVHRGVAPQHVAAITFTEAAAAELRDRIRRRLEERSVGAERDRCTSALADLDRAAITTLHGFALRVLTEHAIDAGLPPRVAVLDEVTSQLRQAQRWEHFVDDLYDEPDHEEVLLRAHALGILLESRSVGKATLAGVAATLSQSWDRLDAIVATERPTLADIDFGPYDRAVAELELAPQRCLDPADPLHEILNDRIAMHRRVVAEPEVNRKLGSFPTNSQHPPWGHGRSGVKQNWTGGAQAVRDLVDATKEVAVDIRASASASALRVLMWLIAGEVVRAADERRQEGLLEFHDLLVHARNLLRSSERARAALHARYQYLLLDEFQDTDPLQVELATLIAGTVDGADVPPWDAVDVPAGRLFFVGDWKQSIYRFRRADIELFLRASARFRAGGPQVGLTSNFRTVEPILSFVNGLFEAADMAEAVGGVTPTYEHLLAARTGPSDPGAHAPVVFGGSSTLRADALRALEAADVAGAIVDIVERPARWQVEDDDGWRDPRRADITVLVPTRTSLPFLRAALDEVGISYRLDTGSLVFASQEVADVLAVVRAIADSTDDISLVTALRSSLFACSDVDLFTYCDAGGRWDISKPPDESLDPDHPVVTATGYLHGLWEKRWWMGPAELVDCIVNERRAMLTALGAERPRDVWRRMRFLVDQARAFEDAGQRGLREFVAWAELQGSEAARVHEPVLPETDDDAVRIMTIHGAKGLEFPITIVSGLTTKPGTGPRMSVTWHDGVPQANLPGGNKTEDFDRSADIEEEMDVREKRRLLYVALTRARDHLVVSAHHREKEPSSHGAMVARHAKDHPVQCRRLDELVGERATEPVEVSGIARSAAARDEDSVDIAAAADRRAQWLAARRRLAEDGGRRAVYSATGVAAMNDPLAASELDDDGSDTDEPADLGDGEHGSASSDSAVPPRRQGRAGTAIGRAVHATLQSLDLATIDPDSPVIDQIAAREAELEAVVEAASQIAGGVRAALA
ncbi:MAG: UvrD-helicase domain-containing protein, partial [Actinomycetota bacterium]|nr:UvrD-helicase domain-containing protein [Actinomycetota bacterium]